MHIACFLRSDIMQKLSASPNFFQNRESVDFSYDLVKYAMHSVIACSLRISFPLTLSPRWHKLWLSWVLQRQWQLVWPLQQLFWFISSNKRMLMLIVNYHLARKESRSLETFSKRKEQNEDKTICWSSESTFLRWQSISTTQYILIWWKAFYRNVYYTMQQYYSTYTPKLPWCKSRQWKPRWNTSQQATRRLQRSKKQLLHWWGCSTHSATEQQG